MSKKAPCGRGPNKTEVSLFRSAAAEYVRAQPMAKPVHSFAICHLPAHNAA
jgi:hypothetical protein